jgi:mannose-1-phosphate guanylyltransferase/phosphomannomutase
MKAMILAAGKGTRIRQVTKGEIPKPMVNLGPGPLLEHTVKKLCRFGVEEIVINLSYKGSEIKDYFGKEILDTPIYYSEEDNPLGTAGGVKKVEERFNDSFLLIYGDILTDLDLDKFVSTHKENGVDATVLGYKERNTEKLTESGVMLTDNSNEIRTFIEKPSEKKLTHLDKQEIWTNGAVFVLEPSIINFI